MRSQAGKGLVLVGKAQEKRVQALHARPRPLRGSAIFRIPQHNSPHVWAKRTAIYSVARGRPIDWAPELSRFLVAAEARRLLCGFGTLFCKLTEVDCNRLSRCCASCCVEGHEGARRNGEWASVLLHSDREHSLSVQCLVRGWSCQGNQWDRLTYWPLVAFRSRGQRSDRYRERCVR